MSKRKDAIEVELTGGNVRNSHSYLRDFLGFFPVDAVGEAREADGEGRRLCIEFEGLDEHVETDMAGGNKLFLRRRGPIRRFFERHGLEAGDAVRFERQDAYRFKALPVRRR